jgi:hypothetical protein
LYGICGVQHIIGAGFSPSTLVSACQFTFHRLLHIYHLSSKAGTVGQIVVAVSHHLLWLYCPILGLGRLHETFRFISVTRSRIVGRTRWTGDQLLARHLLPALIDCDDDYDGEVGRMNGFWQGKRKYLSVLDAHPPRTLMILWLGSRNLFMKKDGSLFATRLNHTRASCTTSEHGDDCRKNVCVAPWPKS